MSRFLVARVVLIVAAVTVPVLHIIVIIVIVIEEVGAFIRGRGTCADTVLCQCSGHLYPITLSFSLSG